MKAIKAYDAGEKFADRYTIEFDTGDAYSMSDDANMPNGCCIYSGNKKDPKSGHSDSIILGTRGRKISFDSLPKGTKRQIALLEIEK